MFKYYQAVKKRDPLLNSFLAMLFFYPGIKAVFFYKIAHWLYFHHLRIIAKFIMLFVRYRYSIDISPKAVIGKYLFIDHGVGVVIGSTTVIGDNCTIYQGVTLGSKNATLINDDNIKRHPTIGNNVIIGAGSVVLGNIKIGNDVIIGANTVVLEDIEDKKTVVGIKKYQKW